jgi:ubiquinone/menaquinone biosynthesis C-methylase UbiE
MARRPTTDICEWERAEVARSEAEAAATSSRSLLADEQDVQRYIDPPAATSYPLEYAFHLLGNVRGRAVLDVGCGAGENSLLLARRGARVLGVDISPGLLGVARRRLELNGLGRVARFAVASAHALPVADGSVEVVFGAAILHHLDLTAAAREVARVLPPGGRAIFLEPVRDSALIRALRRLIPYRRTDVSPFERPLVEAELREFGARFSRQRARAFVLPLLSLAEVLRVREAIVHRLYRLDGSVLRAWPALGHYAALRVVEFVK